jgi:hypothetical protein
METKISERAFIDLALGAGRAFVISAPPSDEWREYRFDLPAIDAVRIIYKLLSESDVAELFVAENTRAMVRMKEREEADSLNITGGAMEPK